MVLGPAPFGNMELVGELAVGRRTGGVKEWESSDLSPPLGSGSSVPPGAISPLSLDTRKVVRQVAVESTHPGSESSTSSAAGSELESIIGSSVTTAGSGVASGGSPVSILPSVASASEVENFFFSLADRLTIIAIANISNLESSKSVKLVDSTGVESPTN
jgi:hypothetical protein